MKKAFSNKCYNYFLWGVVLTFAFSGKAFAAADEIDEILKNITLSGSKLPGLLSAASYMLGLLLGVLGILKIKEHVENPNQAPLRTGVIRLLAGGALFALPIIFEAMRQTINPGAADVFDPSVTMGDAVSGLIGGGLGILGMDFNGILKSIIDSVKEAPGFISAVTYLLGLLFGVTGVLKIKDHVENPDQTPMREGVIRLLTGGALFAIPTIYTALFEAIGAGGWAAGITSIFSILGIFFSAYSTSLCNPLGLKMGNAICGVVMHAGGFPAFLTAMGYLVGLVMAVWGILKIKAHVLDPRQTQLHEGLTRLLAAGLFFSLPAIVQVARATMGSGALLFLSLIPDTGFNEPGALACAGLDGVVYCMMKDIFGPMNVLLNFFSISAGTVLIMIGISRLIKSAQEGARGPGGIGTIMTFMAGGALISYNELMRAATFTFFTPTAGISQTSGALDYTVGMAAAEVAHAHIVISAIMKFMIIVGLISFVRGIFIIRDVAEGNQQASLMAGITHMVGGALAVNLGPLLNAVQQTLGMVGFGITFS